MGEGETPPGMENVTTTVPITDAQNGLGGNVSENGQQGPTQEVKRESTVGEAGAAASVDGTTPPKQSVNTEEEPDKQTKGEEDKSETNTDKAEDKTAGAQSQDTPKDDPKAKGAASGGGTSAPKTDEHVTPDPESKEKSEVDTLAQHMRKLVQITYGLKDEEPEQWETILNSYDTANQQKKIPQPLRNALIVRAKILQTQKAIQKEKRNNASKPSNAQAAENPIPAPETDWQIERRFGYDQKENLGGYYEVDKDGNVIEPVNKLYNGQTYDAYLRELDRIDTEDAKRTAKEIRSMLTRDIKHPDVYLFDTSPNKELKRRNDLNYSVSDAIVLSLEDQLNGETDIVKIAQAIKDGTIKADPSVGLLAKLLVWYDQAEADPQKRNLLSGLMYDELRRLDANKLNKLGKNSKYKEAVDKILQYRSDSSKESELGKTQKMFEGYRDNFYAEIIHQVRVVYGDSLANNLMQNLSNKRSHTIPMFLCAHVIENSDFMTRDETGHIVLKNEYDTQLTELTQVLGFSPAEKQMIVDLALKPSGSVAIMKDVLGIDGRLLDSETGMEEQAHKASEIIVGRLQTDPEPIIPGVEANQDIEEALKSGMGKAIADMIRLDMGPAMHIDEHKFKKLLGKSFGMGAMGLLLFWQQIMGALTTDENTLAPQGGGQQRHQ